MARPSSLAGSSEAAFHEALLETLSADSESSDECVASDLHDVQTMLKRADWLHHQSDRQVRFPPFPPLVSAPHPNTVELTERAAR